MKQGGEDRYMYFCSNHPDRLAIKVCACGRMLCEICSEQAEALGKCQQCLAEDLKGAVLQMGEDGTVTLVRSDRCSDHPTEQVYARCKCGRRLCRSCYEEARQFGVCTHCFKMHSQAEPRGYPRKKKKYRRSFLSFLWDLITRKGAKSVPYYGGSRLLFASYSGLRLICILIGIIWFLMYRQFAPQIPIGLAILFSLMMSSWPIMIFGIIDMIYQLRRKHSRIRILIEVLFYYFICSFLISRVEPYLEVPQVVETTQTMKYLLSPLFAVLTEIHMWKAKKKFYTQKRKRFL